MMRSKTLSTTWLLLVLASLWNLSRGLAADAPQKPKGGVQRTNYLGWSDCYVLTGSALRAVVVPAVGGRILEYSLGGQNILAPGGAGTASGTALFKSDAGGYQLDIGPKIAGLPAHDALWSGPYAAKPFEDYGVAVTSVRDPRLGIELEKEILIDPESGDLGITQRARNGTKAEVNLCLWDRTVCKGGGFAFFPLKKKSRFPARWAVHRTANGKEYYDGAKPQAPNVRVMNGILVAKCDGEATRIGADSEAGWIGYVRDKWLFIKYFPYSGKGHYSDGGNSVEVYFDPRATELGPVSPEVRIKPGEAYDFPEKWTLIELDGRVTTFDEARALVAKVGPSPFD